MLLPELERPCALAVVTGTKFTTQLRPSQKAFITMEETEDTRVHAQQPGQCNQGEGTAGGNPIHHVWAISDRQVCQDQERLSGHVSVVLGDQLNKAGSLLHKTKDCQNEEQQLHRHHLKLEIK